MLVSEKQQQQNQFHAKKGAGVDCVKKTKKILKVLQFTMWVNFGGRGNPLGSL